MTPGHQNDGSAGYRDWLVSDSNAPARVDIPCDIIRICQDCHKCGSQDVKINWSQILRLVCRIAREGAITKEYRRGLMHSDDEIESSGSKRKYGIANPLC